MSVSLILVPLALAAVAAAHGARTGRDAQGRVVCEVRTRMRDANLLAAALGESNAVVTVVDADCLTASWDGVQATFRRDQDGIWSAHFIGDVNEQSALDIATRLDEAYGRQVQRAVLARLRERAPAAGLRLESENVSEDDNSVRLVFQVEAV